MWATREVGAADVDGTAAVQAEGGVRHTFDPARSAMLRLYEIEDIQLAPGDWVRVTGNDKALDLRNGERFEVAALGAGYVALKRGSDLVNIDRRRPMHLQHGYASTVHSAQGLTTQRVLIEADTKSLTSNRAVFYVAISRPRDGLKIFTNDKRALASSMSRDPKKFAALELRDARSEADILKAKTDRSAQAKLAAQLRPLAVKSRAGGEAVRRT